MNVSGTLNIAFHIINGCYRSGGSDDN